MAQLQKVKFFCAQKFLFFFLAESIIEAVLSSFQIKQKVKPQFLPNSVHKVT